MAAVLFVMFSSIAYVAIRDIMGDGAGGINYLGQPVNGALQLIGVIVGLPVLIFCTWKYIVKGQKPEGTSPKAKWPSKPPFEFPWEK